MAFRTKFLLVCFDLRPSNNPITAWGATSFPGYHSFPKWAIQAVSKRLLTRILLCSLDLLTVRFITVKSLRKAVRFCLLNKPRQGKSEIFIGYMIFSRRCTELLYVAVWTLNAWTLKLRYQNCNLCSSYRVVLFYVVLKRQNIFLASTNYDIVWLYGHAMFYQRVFSRSVLTQKYI